MGTEPADQSASAVSELADEPAAFRDGVAGAGVGAAAGPSQILALQRSVGNRAVGRLFASSPVPARWLSRQPTATEQTPETTYELNQNEQGYLIKVGDSVIA